LAGVHAEHPGERVEERPHDRDEPGQHHRAGRAARFGLRGLRVCVDLTDAPRAAPPAGPGDGECLLAAVCGVQARPPALICHSDRTRASADRLRAQRAGHALVLEAGEAPWHGPLLLVGPMDDPAGVRLSGEADRSNLDRLAAALRDAPRDGRDLHLNMRGLRHLDVEAARLLARTAGAMPAGGRLVLHSPGPVVRAILRAFAWDGDLVMKEGDRG
ncbi:STAS domain-containing protein, partial [Actinomadura roseirufa]|uniref:STAS domain-containing protein n=1 Tax=Actinomadura roseirufa TaxID=2094049 RepID=UPI0013F16EB9